MYKIQVYDSNYELLEKTAILLNTDASEVLNELIDAFFDDYLSDEGISREELEDVEL